MFQQIRIGARLHPHHSRAGSDLLIMGEESARNAFIHRLTLAAFCFVLIKRKDREIFLCGLCVLCGKICY